MKAGPIRFSRDADGTILGRNFGASMRSKGRARSPLRIHDPALLSVLPDSLAAP